MEGGSILEKVIDLKIMMLMGLHDYRLGAQLIIVSYHRSNYADDTQLYMACDNNKASVMQAVKSLEDCIADISEWMGCNSMKINEDKTEFVIFSRNPDKYSDITRGAKQGGGWGGINPP